MKVLSFGDKIRDLRKRHHMTQAVLAEKLGVTDKAVSKWERNLSYPDISLFPALADTLGVSSDDLLNVCGGEIGPSRLLRIFHMSRDVRTPLNAVLGYAYLARKHYQEPDKLIRYLENIQVSGEYLLKVIDNMMQIAHREPGNAGGAGMAGDGAGDGAPIGVDDGAPGEEAEESGNAAFAGKRILIVEDNPLNREIVSEILKETGLRIDYAEDGSVCIDKIENTPAGFYDLILMDVEMPNLDGLAATRMIRAMEDKEKAGIPIIAITANVYEEARRAAFEAGMNDFVEKPIDIDVLLGKVKKYLRKS